MFLVNVDRTKMTLLISSYLDLLVHISYVRHSCIISQESVTDYDSNYNMEVH